MKQSIVIFLLFVASFFHLSSTEKSETYPYRFGIFGGPNFVMNNSSIPVIPGTDDCGNFENGNSISYFGGINFVYKFFSGLFSLDGRLMFESRPAFLSKGTTGYEVYHEATDSYLPLMREHKFDAPLQYLVFDFGARINPLKQIPIYTRLAFDAGNPLFSSDFSNEEEIISPNNINFPDNTKRRTVESGELNTAGTAFGLNFGIGYDLKLESGMIITPEISYRHGLNSIASDRDWNVNILKAAIVVSWEFGADNIEPVVQEESKELLIEEPKEEETEIADFISQPEIMNVISNDLLIRETVVSQTYPLLPYMFFDSVSTEINDIYMNEGNLIDEAKLAKNSLQIYYFILDILGKRLIDNPNGNLTIIGVTDGVELPDSLSRKKLAEQRAKNVVKYIADKYEIDTKRFIITSRDMPQIPTSSKYSEGLAENRRVEFIASDPELMKPVSNVQFLEYASQIDKIEIQNEIAQSDEIDRVQVEILKGGNLIAEKMISDPTQNINFELDQALTYALGDASTNDMNTNIRTTIYKNGKTIDTKISKLNIESERDAFELIRLNLIVFDFDKSEISNTNKVMIEDFINTKITRESEVKITGSTDRLGEKEYNLELSQLRAQAVEKYIRQNKTNPNITEVKGIGSSKLLFDNSLPEGRFYCRTVLIEVKTKFEVE